MSRRMVRISRGFSLAVITGAVGLTSLVPAAYAEVRVGPNYRLNSDPNSFRGKDQVGLAVNPANPNHIVETNANYLTETCEGSASFDGGETWSEAFPLVPATPPTGLGFLPSCRVGNHLAEHTFQTVAFGSGQNVYATTITPRASAAFGEEGAGTVIYKSTDGGVTWGRGVVAMPGGPRGTNATNGPYYELPTVVADPGAGPNGADIVYSAARETTGVDNSGPPCPSSSCPSIRLAVSTDGGQTFSAPRQASPPGLATAGPDSSSQPVLGADGSIGIAWRTLGATGSIQFARSTNQGQTWTAPVTVVGVQNIARPSSSHVTPAPSSGSSFPRMAINRRNGNLYIVYNQGSGGPTAPTGGFQGADHFIPPDSQVYFQRSLDNGATWSPPRRINDATPPIGTRMVQTRHPSVSVAPNGRVDVVWQDRRHWYMGPGERVCVHTHIACDDARMGDTYYAYSTNSGATFSADRRITDRSHNNDVGYDYRFGVGWGFGPVSVPLADNQLLIGWMDSREGNTDNDNLDIYLAKVDHDPSGPVPQANIDQPDPVELSVALSRVGYEGGNEGVLAGTFATRNASRVVIVNQNDVAGALAASVLARANLGPVLLSPAGGLPDSVRNEVARIAPAGAIIVGDTSALSAQVASDLAAAGVDPAQVTRVSGASDAATAAQIATLMDRRSPAETTAAAPAFDAAIIANPASPDAAAAAALAAARRLPFLYVSSGAVPAATASALSSLNINRTLVVGGPAQVGAAVLGGLPSATRLGGSNQYETSRAVADQSVVRGLPSNIVYAADGTRPMDAALLGAAVGRANGIMLLAPAPLYSSVPDAASAVGLDEIDRFVLVGPPAPSPGGGGPGATPPAGGADTPPPPPPPAAVQPRPTTPARGRGRLTARVTPAADLRPPYRFTISGRLTRPAAVSTLAGCRGQVSVQTKRGGTTISTRRVFLRRNCTYSVRVTFRNRGRFGTARSLRFTARFLGNARVAPATAAARFARVRR